MTALQRRRVLLVAALWLVAVAAAQPSPAGATSVDGGGSFDDAPLLRPGTYTDTILPLETLFYAVAVGAGQRLRVSAEVDLRGGSKNDRGDADALGGFGLTLYSPLRERLGGDYVGPLVSGGPDHQSDSDARRGPRVLSANAADRRKIAGSGQWIGPGIYSFTAAVSAIYQDPGAVVEFPLRLQVAVEGPTVPARSVGPGPLGEAAQPAGPRPAAPARSADRAVLASTDRPTRISALALLVAAGGALLAGALLARLAGAIARRPHGPSP
jgi:Ca-activated chloride channel family protein